MRSRYISLAWAAAAAVSCGGGGDATAPQQTAASVAAVLVNPPTSTIPIGTAVPLQAQVQDGDGKLIPTAAVMWTVEDSTIATVSAAGVVTARALGSTKVAASFNGKSGIATVTVQKIPVASVALQPSHVDLIIGATRQLGATPYDAGQNALTDRPISWSSSNERVATVDAAGLLTAVGAGAAVITATSEGKSATATVTVAAPAPVASVAVAPPTAAVVYGQTVTFVATLRDAGNNVLTGRAIAWSSSDARVATVSNGVVTPVGSGSATITATSEGRSGSATVTVTIPVGTVTLQPASLTIAPGQTAGLTATTIGTNGAPLGGRAVTYVSSNTSVARVSSSSGVVTGISNGTATITATSEGKTATVPVTVQPGSATAVYVSPNAAYVQRGGKLQLTATAYDYYDNPIVNRPFDWQSSDSTIATVSSTGEVKGLRKGSVYVTVSLDGVGTLALIVVP